jgi:hypothetical protein
VDEEKPAEGEEQEVGDVEFVVMPSEPNKPPRALMIAGMVLLRVDADGQPHVGLLGNLLTWSSDQGAWLNEDGGQVADELGEAITARAKELGVEW